MTNTAAAHGCNITGLEWSEVPYPPTVNHPVMADLVRLVVWVRDVQMWECNHASR